MSKLCTADKSLFASRLRSFVTIYNNQQRIPLLPFHSIRAPLLTSQKTDSAQKHSLLLAVVLAAGLAVGLVDTELGATGLAGLLIAAEGLL